MLKNEKNKTKSKTKTQNGVWLQPYGVFVCASLPFSTIAEQYKVDARDL